MFIYIHTYVGTFLNFLYMYLSFCLLSVCVNVYLELTLGIVWFLVGWMTYMRWYHTTCLLSCRNDWFLKRPRCTALVDIILRTSCRCSQWYVKEIAQFLEPQAASSVNVSLEWLTTRRRRWAGWCWRGHAPDHHRQVLKPPTHVTEIGRSKYAWRLCSALVFCVLG